MGNSSSSKKKVLIIINFLIVIGSIAVAIFISMNSVKDQSAEDSSASIASKNYEWVDCSQTDPTTEQISADPSKCGYGYACVEESDNKFVCSSGKANHACDINENQQVCRPGLLCKTILDSNRDKQMARCASSNDGSVCNSDADCTAGLSCKKFPYRAFNVCVSNSKEERVEGYTCDPNTLPCAEDHTCVKTVVDRNDNSKYTYLCSSGRPGTRCDASGSGCLEGINCINGYESKSESHNVYVCTDGGSNTPCVTNLDCQTGSKCVEKSTGFNVCVPIEKAERTNWSFCNPEYPCASGYTCVNQRGDTPAIPNGQGVCTSGISGSPCDSESKNGCQQNNRCINLAPKEINRAEIYRCTSGDVNSLCGSDADCLPDYSCERLTNFSTGRCIAKTQSNRTQGSPCSSTSPCASGYECVANGFSGQRYCSNLQNYRACDKYEKTCASTDLKCVNTKEKNEKGTTAYKCTEGELNNPCGTDEDCKPGLECIKFNSTWEGRCSFESQSQRGNWALCDSNRSCAGGFQCINWKHDESDNGTTELCSNGSKGSPCADSSGCEQGYSCETVDVDGSPDKRCVISSSPVACGYKDIDQNGKLTITDYMAFVKVWKRPCSDTNLNDNVTCGLKDDNKDGKINIIDFVKFIEMYVNGCL